MIFVTFRVQIGNWDFKGTNKKKYTDKLKLN